MIEFLRENRRYLGAGFLLTFASAFGQTWFISLFADQIKSAHGLSDGGWGSLYTAATLASAGMLFARGALADTMPLARLAPIVALIFAGAGLVMAFGGPLWLLGLAIFGLRFCGQGMFGHIAMTAMGRWFRARRGRAVAIVALGYPVGEMVLPVLAVFAIGAFGPRAVWSLVALVLALAVAPGLRALLLRGRAPQGMAEGEAAPGLQLRHWTRADALGHWLFWALLPILLTPGFIGTVVFFHQVHIANVKGWTLVEMAPGYPVYASMAILASFASGWFADRFGPAVLLPVLLLPMSLGIALIGPAVSVTGWFAALGLIALTNGTASTLWGAFLPFAYGTRNLGSVRSLVTTFTVLSTAIGPGITGLLIDAGIDFPRQCLAMGVWCLALSGLGFAICRRVRNETDPAALAVD